METENAIQQSPDIKILIEATLDSPNERAYVRYDRQGRNINRKIACQLSELDYLKVVDHLNDIMAIMLNSRERTDERFWKR